jgi:hypothetical protein
LLMRCWQAVCLRPGQKRSGLHQHLSQKTCGATAQDMHTGSGVIRQSAKASLSSEVVYTSTQHPAQPDEAVLLLVPHAASADRCPFQTSIFPASWPLHAVILRVAPRFCSAAQRATHLNPQHRQPRPHDVEEPLTYPPVWFCRPCGITLVLPTDTICGT